MAFGTPGVQPVSTYRIAPTNNMLQRNMYGNRYSEYVTSLMFIVLMTLIRCVNPG
jgi:hypothetical protein